MFKKTASYTLKEATKKLEGYCAYQERCHQEVTQKLHEMGMIPEAIDHIIAHLIKENYLNEERFAKSFARGKFTLKNWGRVRITHELKQRQISRFNIKTALQEIDGDTYLVALHALATKRLAAINASDKQTKRKKLADYLVYRGWESDLVYSKIAELIP